ncbi:MAG: DUF2007 domain-containing protein [Anaerolineae bacterium]|nr:DUF2007 domain-containing protein [Anaerolineae bacterium]
MDQEPKDVRLVTVQVIHGMLRANVIRGLLESAGIPVMLRYEAAGPAIGLIIDGLGRVEIQVPDEWEQEARDLLAAEPSADATEEPADDNVEETWDEIAASAQDDADRLGTD